MILYNIHYIWFFQKEDGKVQSNIHWKPHHHHHTLWIWFLYALKSITFLKGIDFFWTLSVFPFWVYLITEKKCSWTFNHFYYFTNVWNFNIYFNWSIPIHIPVDAIFGILDFFSLLLSILFFVSYHQFFNSFIIINWGALLVFFLFWRSFLLRLF